MNQIKELNEFIKSRCREMFYFQMNSDVLNKKLLGGSINGTEIKEYNKKSGQEFQIRVW